MATCNQITRFYRKKKKKINKTPALQKCPQKKAFCIKLVFRTPRKPNSALRKITKVRVTNGKKVYAYIPGEGHLLKRFATVLMRGGKVKDLVGVKYHLIRGKFDFVGLLNRKTARSKYGAKNIRRYL